MIPWDLLSLAREQQLRELKAKANRLIHHKDTSRTFLTDYPKVLEYISQKFPRIDLNHVDLYLTSQRAMNLVGFKYMGGCYIDALKTIFVLDEKSLNSFEKVSGRFNKAVLRASKTTLHVEDILVHEALHAVSSCMQRATKAYTNAEEEFVYTHCVDFYRDSGMDDEQIIKAQFLPFCLNDILGDKQELSEIFAKLKKAKSLRVVPWERDYAKDEYSDFLDKHADFLATEVIEAAKTRARYMIECYEKYGCRSVSAEDVDHSTSVRFQGLNFD